MKKSKTGAEEYLPGEAQITHTPGFPEKGQAEVNQQGKPLRKPFRKLFSRSELWHYGIAAAIYIVMGLFLGNAVLNFTVGPLFMVAWMWCIPPLVDKWKPRRYRRSAVHRGVDVVYPPSDQ